MSNSQFRTWVEIDLKHIEYNYRLIKNNLPCDTTVCCVVKANAYGHGAASVAKLLEKIGVDFFAVASIDEAIHLREKNINSRILVLGYTPVGRIADLVRYNISQCVYCADYAKSLAEEAELRGVRIAVHIKIDVGMGRLGFVVRDGDQESFSELIRACSYSCFDSEGIFTHFPTADGGDNTRDVTRMQYERFMKIVERLKDQGISFKLRHCANSATAIDYPEYSLDMVRIGIALYGALPSADIKNKLPLKDTFTLKTVVAGVKTLLKGETVGYGSEYVAKKDVKIATLPIGYADGFLRANYSNGSTLSVKGNPCRIVGRVCMDQIMVDVDGIDDVNIGDEVIVFGEGSPISLSEFAAQNQTIPYEIISNVGARVPRLYRWEDGGLFV